MRKLQTVSMSVRPATSARTSAFSNATCMPAMHKLSLQTLEDGRTNQSLSRSSTEEVPCAPVGVELNIHDLPPEVLVTIIRERLSGKNLFEKLEWWAVCHQWRDISNSDNFWVNLLRQPPLYWHHDGTLGARNADLKWHTGMTAFAFFRMLYRLTPDERELILSMTSTTTTIQEEAFFHANLSGLTSLPPNLKTIEVIAFSLSNLSGLTSLPPNLATIKTDAFYNADLSGLTSLPPNLATIEPGAFAFADLRGLTSLPSAMILESLRINEARLPDFMNSTPSVETCN